MSVVKNKIIFLGTGGGGSMVSLQKCSTAGFWVNLEGVNLYFDPGPSAIYKIREAKLVPDDLKAILVTHCHLDHISDVNALIEAVHYQMTRHGWNYRDYQLLVPPDVIRENYIIQNHKKMVGKIVQVQSQKKYKVEHLTIKSTKRLLEKPCYKDKHDEFGYQVIGKKYSFAYIPETYYKKGLFKDVNQEIVILNAMKPTGDYYRETVKVIKELSPKLVLLQHWVNKTLIYGRKKLAAKLQKETGVKVMAMKDGDVFDLKTGRLKI